MHTGDAARLGLHSTPSDAQTHPASRSSASASTRTPFRTPPLTEPVAHCLGEFVSPDSSDTNWLSADSLSPDGPSMASVGELISSDASPSRHALSPPAPVIRERRSETESAMDLDNYLTYSVQGGEALLVSSDVPDELICGICLCIVVQPTVTTCGHLFCAICLRKAMCLKMECPVDRTQLRDSNIFKDARAQRQINMLRCRCLASLPEEMQKQLLGLRFPDSTSVPSDLSSTRGVRPPKEHRSSAGGRARKPLHFDAGLSRRPYNVVCRNGTVDSPAPLVTAPTPFSGGGCDEAGASFSTVSERCGWTGCVSDAGAHLRTCPFALVLCPFAPQGCSSLLSREAMSVHMTSCANTHVSLLCRALSIATAHTLTLREEVDVLRHRWPLLLDTRTSSATRDTPAFPVGNGSSAVDPEASLTPTVPSPVPSPRDRFVWVVSDFMQRRSPCYSRRFTAWGLPWYVGMDTSASSETSGLYLFAQGHTYRTSFRLIMYNEDPAKDLVHVVDDWSEDFKGNGWGPLRFVDRTMLLRSGFVVRNYLRIGVEVVGAPF